MGLSLLCPNPPDSQTSHEKRAWKKCDVFDRAPRGRYRLGVVFGGALVMIRRGVVICLLVAGCPSESTDSPAQPAHEAPSAPGLSEKPPGVAGSRDLPGPLGLEWGAKERDVRKALEQQFGVVRRTASLQDASVRLQAGSGTWNAVQMDSVEVDLLCGEARRLQLFPARDQRSLFRRWQSLVTTMTSQHGAPDTSEEPPSAAGAKGAPPLPVTGSPTPAQASLQRADHAAQQAVMRDILEGRGKLRASWDFSHNRRMVVAGNPSEPDQNGLREVALVWSLLDVGAEEQDCEDHHPELIRLRDF